MLSGTEARVILAFIAGAVVLAGIALLYQFWYIALAVGVGLLALWWWRVESPRRRRARDRAAQVAEFVAANNDVMVELRARFDRQTRDLGDAYEVVRSAAELVVRAQIPSASRVAVKLDIPFSEAVEVVAALNALGITDSARHLVLIDRQFAAAFAADGPRS